MRVLTAAAVVAAVMFSAENAAAQDESRFYLSLNGGFQPGSQTYTDDGTYALYDETGRLKVAGKTAGGALLDVSAGFKVMGNWTLGAGYHRTSNSNPATIVGTAPHPIFFDRPRPFTTTAEDLERTEQAVHFSLGYMAQLSDRFVLHVYAGPSKFMLSQDVVSSVAIAETGGSFATVQVTPTISTRDEDTGAWGGHVALDMSYTVAESGTASFALGGFVRYAQAASEFLVVSNNVSTKIGAVQVGGGLRIRF